MKTIVFLFCIFFSSCGSYLIVSPAWVKGDIHWGEEHTGEQKKQEATFLLEERHWNLLGPLDEDELPLVEVFQKHKVNDRCIDKFSIETTYSFLDFLTHLSFLFSSRTIKLKGDLLERCQG